MTFLRISRKVSITRVNLYKLFTHHYIRNILLFCMFCWKLAKMDITIASVNWISPGTCAISLVASPLRHTAFARLLKRTYVSLYTEMLLLQVRLLALRAHVPRLYQPLCCNEQRSVKRRATVVRLITFHAFTVLKKDHRNEPRKSLAR